VSNMLVAALRLAGEGRPVLPLEGKSPLGGYGLSYATTDVSAIAAWWRRWPAANIGLRCDGLCVVDVDGDPGEESLERLEHRLGPLPLTRAQATGKGRHMLYSAPVELGNSTGALGRPAGIDLRCGRRGYIVCAPSRHPSGRRYRWFDPERPVAALPARWLEALWRPRPRPVALPALSGRSSAYGRAALRDELEREAALVASLAGLSEIESRKTIRSALHAGLRYRRRRGGGGTIGGWGSSDCLVNLE
jgi:Bifunctional DNA primase/polymerase, N-terminal